jgi:hypothetical protein
MAIAANKKGIVDINNAFFHNHLCEERSDAAIFDMLVADFFIGDCHAIARNDAFTITSPPQSIGLL